MRIKDASINDVKPYENNPRNNDDAVELVANSIREFGFKQPLVCDADGTIIAGHTRYRAARMLGIETVPVLYADDLTPEQVNAYRLADNKVAEAAEWDMGKLDEELDGLLGFDMEQFGFVDPEPEEAGSAYTDIVKGLIYEPKGECPGLADLVDTSERDRLAEEIERMDDLDDDVRGFLLEACDRFTEFRYDRIAEYYCHAPEAVKRAMEELKLVIVDKDAGYEVAAAKFYDAIAGELREE